MTGGGRGTASSSIGLPDGRRLGVAEYGRPDGRPVLYFHGLSGSRLEASFADRIAAGLGIRILAFDRPGMGLSSFQRDRSIPDIALDAAHLADLSGVERFSALGVSAGAPYALACGIRLPERVTRIGLVSPAGPFADRRYRSALDRKLRIILRLSVLAPSLFRGFLRGLSRFMMSDPGGFLLRLADHAGAADRDAILANRLLFTENLQEAFRGGAEGPMRDAELLFRQWGFQPSETPQDVFLWHGGRDRILPQGIGIRLSGEIPRSRSSFPAEEGHFSLPICRLEEILSTLATGA